MATKDSVKLDLPVDYRQDFGNVVIGQVTDVTDMPPDGEGGDVLSFLTIGNSLQAIVVGLPREKFPANGTVIALRVSGVAKSGRLMASQWGWLDYRDASGQSVQTGQENLFIDWQSSPRVERAYVTRNGKG